MLQGIRTSTLTVPSFGHTMSLTGVQKMDDYNGVDPWHWTSQQSNSLTQAYPAVFDPSLYSSTPSTPDTPQSVRSRHHTMPTSHPLDSNPVGVSQTPTPPPSRAQGGGKSVKAHPAFKPTWYGFLDTTKDAMTIVEAALQGRLSHISRRPHDKERAEMLKSGTVLVYEENASGIRRWTDAVHWSPSRVMNNCLIYRQLIRALKPEEKRAALNPSCGSKRKRKESGTPSLANNGDSSFNGEDEYAHSTMEASGDGTSVDSFGRVYANFAQNLTPDQQRRFCGSLIDSYEFKEAGLMKKTISVKYQGTHHHIISYYSLEDVVSGKLQRPCQDPNLADIHPRPELLSGWKVSLEDEENKDAPMFASYSHHVPSSHVQHSAVGGVTRNFGGQGGAPVHAPAHLRMPPDYWHRNNVQQFSSPQHPAPSYGPPQHTTSPYAQQISQEYPTQSSIQHYPPQSSGHQYAQASPPQQQYPQRTPTSEYPPQITNNEQYHIQSPQAAGPTSYPTQLQPTQSYPPATPTRQYPEQHASRYPGPQNGTIAQQTQYTLPQAQTFDMSVPINGLPLSPVGQATQSSIPQPESHRRASAPVTMQPYDQTQSPSHYQPTVQPQTFYIPDSKFTPEGYGY